MALPILFSKGTSSSRWLTDLDDDAKFHLLIAICDTGLNPPFISCGPFPLIYYFLQIQPILKQVLIIFCIDVGP
jgi:hypothetical protein